MYGYKSAQNPNPYKPYICTMPAKVLMAPENSSCWKCSNKFSNCPVINQSDRFRYVKCSEFAVDFDPKTLDGYDKLKPISQIAYLEEFYDAKRRELARAAEVKRELENDAEENDIRYKELFYESPSKEVIEKARKEIFGSWLDEQVTKEKEAASVRSDWDIYSDLVAKNIYRIPREGVEALAKEYVLDKKVFDACVGKYFAQFANTCPLEALKISIQHKGFKDEKKWNERDENEKNDYYKELEVRLLYAIRVISDLKNEPFANLCSLHNISEATLRYFINLFISFGRAVLEGVSILHQEDNKPTPIVDALRKNHR